MGTLANSEDPDDIPRSVALIISSRSALFAQTKAILRNYRLNLDFFYL